MNKLELPVVPPMPGDSKNFAGFQTALAQAISGEVRCDRLSRALYSTDASVYQIVPLCVVIPKNETDVVETIRICSRFGIPITARGGGTSQAGQAIGPGVVLDFSKYLNRILEINPTERWVRVEPGCVLDDLNDAVKPHGLQFAPDISTSNRATIGGMVANNSSGTHSLIHGKTIDHVIGLKVLLADGSIMQTGPMSNSQVESKCAQQDREGECYSVVRRLAEEHKEEIEKRYPKILRRVGGYNLDRFIVGHRPSATGHRPNAESRWPKAESRGFNMADLLVGSEGTLGITLEATLRLIELPKVKVVMVVHFHELLDALAAAPGILAHQPSAVEVIDKYVLDSTRLNPEASRLRDFIHGDPGAILIVEFYGERKEDLPGRLDALEADLKKRGQGYHVHRATESAAQGRIWKLRKAALGLSMAEKGDAKALSFVEDTAVAPERLRDYIAEFLKIVASHGTTAGVYAHASVGCLHVRPVINLKTEAGVGQFEAIAAAVADLVLKYGGALSGEHGDGLVRSPFQEKMFGPALYQAFRELKRTFDPQGILNPGKIVDAPPLSSNLRYGPSYVTPNVLTTFDFSQDGGLVQAAELCAGVGECRKKRDGVMCPSYQATCEEQHSTRGRANALRLALTGQLGLDGLTDPALAEALDLCLECKACKSECPTNVDMARLKAEFLDQYFRKNGLPFRNRIFGQVAKFARWGSHFPRLFNFLARNPISRWINDKCFGIDRRRKPPALALRSFFRQFAKAGVASGQWPVAGRATALLFVDTFANYYEPAVAWHAYHFLNSIGGKVIPAGHASLATGHSSLATGHWPLADGLVCCGRPMISNGMLSRAVEHARINVDKLYPWAESGKPIIACEPSCILTIKDDYPALLRGEERKKAETVAAMCRTFEEYAEDLLASGGSAVAVGSGSWQSAAATADCHWASRPPIAESRKPKKILVQAHCHQRSLVGMTPIMNLLRRIPGAEVIDLDAGCCGMAGSFGYEKEHYEISRLVGEHRLFPAIRQADADTIIVAPGFSCRMQIEHFTGRKALHPAQALWPLEKQ
jgi:FAD/FMN-containing dehydrogenase/Fe-S oxidoreductase